MTEPTRGRSERKDAIANRRRLLDAAWTYFSTRSVDAPMRGVAQTAGMGEASLYRHFASHQDLIRAMYDDLVAALGTVIEAATSQSDPEAGVKAFINGSIEVLKRFPASSGVMSRQALYDPEYRPGRIWEDPLVALVAAAHEQGTLRVDVQVTDLAQIPQMFAPFMALPTPIRDRVVARLLAVVSDGLRPTAAVTNLDDDSLDVEEFHASVHQDISE